MNALSGVWEKIEGEHLKELAARMEKNSKARHRRHNR